jgi:hypothetical protein
MTEEDLAELRAYRPADVDRLLNIPITRVERWVREDRVPHRRAGVARGVGFTAEDVSWIGSRLPELIGGRRGPQPAEDLEGEPAAGGGASGPVGLRSGRNVEPPAAAAVPPMVDIAAWAQLRAHQPRPRSK